MVAHLRKQLFLSFFLLILVGQLALTNQPGWSHPFQRTRLTGRIELLNSKIKAKNGKQDASGVVVWLEAPGLSARPNRPRQTMNQRGKRFYPHVMVVEKGTEIDFPNSDPFFHNVFSLFNGKRFDLGLYASGESRPVLFNRVGISYIFCGKNRQRCHRSLHLPHLFFSHFQKYTKLLAFYFFGALHLSRKVYLSTPVK